ncbi:hypothetical protein SG34_029525 [Thalassomonas viridans]|uniref:Uncharacterized protein n=1 Tax=Thalassomonas viridans TaxID=137584 RepID=A0AAE9ZAH8_9GAMM|nr:hypothetical protein [Thalassomonas viridans]WDE08883.1 hypothetical protein SG34_033890 [Thalassomonas viridans]WDE08930.1 hypothetical protein SG34_029525 [Thalassomonas viridans]
MQQLQTQWQVADTFFTGESESGTKGKSLFAVRANGKAYTDIGQLLQDYPCLRQADVAGVCAQIMLFLHKGEQDRVIMDAGRFKQGYQSRLLQERLDPGLAPLYRQHPEFDVSRIRPPQWQHNLLSFFFVDHTSRLPYSMSYQYQADVIQGHESINQGQVEGARAFECHLLASL